MKKLLVTLLSCTGLLFASVAQNAGNAVITTDIDHFWQAYDSARTTTDSLRQLQYIQTLYIDPGTVGLRAFMQLKDYNAASYVAAIRRYPRFWNSVKPNTLRVKSLPERFAPGIARFKALYPALRPANLYFCIGALRSGGTANAQMVLIGAELATGDSTTDISELPEGYRTRFSVYFKSRPAENIVLLNLHEYVHTQQKCAGYNLLSQSINEGACDFVAELLTGQLPPLPYVQYGPAHIAALKEAFKSDMFATSFRRWLYNGQRDSVPADLGYYMGYCICKAYYDKTADKKQAVKNIIELNYGDSSAVEAFLQQSGFFGTPIDKNALIIAYLNKRPYVLSITPLTTDDRPVSADLKELSVTFSAPMNPNGVSIDLGPGGREHYPITERIGFSDDRRTIRFKVKLKPGYDYSFILTDGSFRSEDGYPLLSCEVRFRTKQ